MIDILYAEIIKLKRSKILMLIPLGGFLPALSMLNMFINGNSTNSVLYFYNLEYFFDVTLYFSNAICPIFFAIFAGYIFTREYQENTINTILTYPFSRFKIFTCKIIVIMGMILSVFLLSMIFTICFGLALKQKPISTEMLITFLRFNLIMALVNLALTPLSILTGIVGKNVIGPVVVGIMLLLCSWFLDINPFNNFILECMPILIISKLLRGLGSNHPIVFNNRFFDAGMTRAYTSISVIFIISFVMCIVYYRYSEVG